MIEEANSEVRDYARAVTLKPDDLPPLKALPGKQFPWFIKLMHEILASKARAGNLLLPNMQASGNKSVGVYSDYGGEHSGSSFYTYSILLTNTNPLECSWLGELRQRYGLGTTEIAFKNLSFGPADRALSAYLANVDLSVVGLLCTLVVDKGLRSLFGAMGHNKNSLTKLLKESNLGEWKIAPAEKLFRVTTIIAYLLGLLGDDEQRLFWMTDHDAISPNAPKHREALDLLSRILPHYNQNSYKVYGGARPFEHTIENGGMYFTDFLSITDLAAGALEQYFSSDRKTQGRPVGKEGSDKVLRWLAHQGVGLKKQTFLITIPGTASDTIEVSDVKLEDLHIPPDARKVTV